jgi:hypothetical protein
MVILAPDKAVFVSDETTLPVTVTLGCWAVLQSCSKQQHRQKKQASPNRRGNFHTANFSYDEIVVMAIVVKQSSLFLSNIPVHRCYSKNVWYSPPGFWQDARPLLFVRLLHRGQ